jgi:hypothetical protein
MADGMVVAAMAAAAMVLGEVDGSRGNAAADDADSANGVFCCDDDADADEGSDCAGDAAGVDDALPDGNEMDK